MCFGGHVTGFAATQIRTRRLYSELKTTTQQTMLAAVGILNAVLMPLQTAYY